MRRRRYDVAMSNPYQPPVDAAADDSANGLSLPRKLNEIQFRWMTRALQTMRFGFWSLLFHTLLCFAVLFLTPSGSARVLRPLITMTCVSSCVVMLGLIVAGWAVPFRPRFLPRIALMCTLLGTTLCTFYFLAVLERGTVAGLFRLFGAASLALLLIGIACIALFIRRTLVADQSHVWIRICDLAVIAYAVSAGVHSAFALNPTIGGFWRMVVPCLAGVTALTLHAFATENATRWWKQSRSDPSAIAAPSA